MTSQRIKQFFDTLDNYSILNWNNLLKFATKKDLELKELKQLAKKSEEFRQHWNSLDIAKEDVFPNIHKLIEQHRREAKNIKHNIESIPHDVAVA